jgi:hypothetical protein
VSDIRTPFFGGSLREKKYRVGAHPLINIGKQAMGWRKMSENSKERNADNIIGGVKNCDI